MLKAENLRWTPPGSGEPLIESVSFRLPPAHLAAVIGPSGCGKSTLLRLLAGINEPDQGEIHWRIPAEEEPSGGHLDYGDLGYAPQFSIAHELLTVRECVADAVRLRVACGQKEARVRIRGILDATGLAEIASSRVRVLSGGQRRRLALAMELASDPAVLLCDEVTSGLDPKSESEITGLLHTLAKVEGRLVISVTHSLAHIRIFDSVLVMLAGRLVFHAPPEYLMHYFRIEHPEELYPRLAKRKPDEWLASWFKHGPAYARLMSGGAGSDVESERPAEQGRVFSPGHHPSDLSDKEKTQLASDRPEGATADENRKRASQGRAPGPGSPGDAQAGRPRRSGLPRRPVPGALAQLGILTRRRLLLFARDGGGIALQAALALGFPLLVALFALNGLPQIRNLSMTLDVGLLQQLQEAYDYIVESTKAGSLVSGLVMLQVILLGLIGANNAAREIAADRQIIEKEKLAGLSPAADLASRVLFLSGLVAAQSLWMAWFVDMVCRFPGEFASQALVLLLVNGAVTATSLAISGWSRSPEQASLLSIYLVGFQLPLSGALLALPDFAAWITRPFIASYWAWSGFLQTMRQTRHYDVAVQVSQTPLSPYEVCVWVLACHILIALFLAWAGLSRKHWTG